jgi:hypothetical protein
MSADIEHCERMIVEEQRRAKAAPSREAAEMHSQMVMLYTAQLLHLRRYGSGMPYSRF